MSGYAGNGLWGLRFADAEHGYAFGAGFWQTANGGASWQRGGGPAPVVFALEAVRDRELVAVGTPCTGCTTKLFHRPIGSGAWDAVATVHTYLPPSIAVHGAVVRVAIGSRVYVSSDGGLTFVSERSACAPGQINGTLLSEDGASAYTLCTGDGAAGSFQKYVYRSAGPGSHWSLVGMPPRGGAPEGLSAGSDAGVLIAAASGASELYRSANGGRSWSIALTEDDGGLGWADLGFTTATDGVVIHGPAMSDRGTGRLGQLLLTENGGLTWHAVSF